MMLICDQRELIHHLQMHLAATLKAPMMSLYPLGVLLRLLRDHTPCSVCVCLCVSFSTLMLRPILNIFIKPHLGPARWLSE